MREGGQWTCQIREWSKSRHDLQWIDLGREWRDKIYRDGVSGRTKIKRNVVTSDVLE